MTDQAHTYDHVDVLLLIFGIGTVVISFGGAMLLGVFGIVSWAMVGSEGMLTTFTSAATLITMCLLSIPIVFSSARVVFGLPRTGRASLPQYAGFASLLLPIGLLIGITAQQFQLFPAILSPVGHTFAALGPVLGASVMVIGRGPLISFRRRWATFNGGLWLTPILALTVEMLLLIPVAAAIFSISVSKLDLAPILQSVFQGETISFTALEEFMNELLTEPLVVVLVVAYIGLLVPMIEEFIKPLFLLPILRRGISGREAFVLGALAGAGYALFEAFFLAQPGESWGLLMVARAGATLMHMFTAGLTAMGVALAISERSVKKILVCYSAAVALHSIWNVSAIVMGAGFLFLDIQGSPFSGSQLTFLSALAVAALILLSAGAYLGLRRFSVSAVIQGPSDLDVPG
jgi:hypothetical protein